MPRERLRSVSMFGPPPEISQNGEAVEADSRLRPPSSTERQLSVPTAAATAASPPSSSRRRRASEYSMVRKKSSPVSVRKLSAMFSGMSEAEVAEAMRELAPRQSAGKVAKLSLFICSLVALFRKLLVNSLEPGCTKIALLQKRLNLLTWDLGRESRTSRWCTVFSGSFGSAI